MITRNIVTLFVLSLFLMTYQTQATSPTKFKTSNQEKFFDSIAKMCGARFEGAMTYPESGQDDFAGKLLIAHITSCNTEELKIAFSVGKDDSRTWIISKTSNGLQLKHDHRHKDGTPHEINMYGGITLNMGDPLSQSFAADKHTASIIPEAATNVWTITFNQELNQMTYYLERNTAPRFKAVLEKVSP